MTSREAADHWIAATSADLYRGVGKYCMVLEPSLLNQLYKSTLSIGSNWCESRGRSGTAKSPVNFLRQARGSAYEAAFQLRVAGLTGLEAIAHDICDALDAMLAADEPADQNPISGPVAVA